ncbi:MAG: helix-turn-helix domain-containing protein [Planctomycetota bacterium]|nr:helix-turn-helix domain-containing protein [Planctomycetota bacterium]
MPRRPNIKNLPSRLLEETATPLYVVDSGLRIRYANEALGQCLGLNREVLVDRKLEYLADDRGEDEDSAKANRLCPPPGWIPLPESVVDSAHHPLVFGVHLEPNRSMAAQCLPFQLGNDSALVCSLHPDSGQRVLSRHHATWLHERIQKFRVAQSSRFHAIPFLGDSPEAVRCFAQARAFALLESSVLVVGAETSQRLDLARAIHYSGFASEGAPNPLLPIDCEQVDGESIREIMLGHQQMMDGVENGEMQHVLLINVCKLNERGQQDLLDLLNESWFRVRILSTSHALLRQLPEFNQELACRLSTLELTIPPLRDRKSDAVVLAQDLLEKSGRRRPLSREAIEALQLYAWQGDYAELKGLVEGLPVAPTDGEIVLSDFPDSFRLAFQAMSHPRPTVESIELDDLLADIETQAIEYAIRASHGNKTVAAKMLGITRARLHRKIAENGGDREPE